MDVVRNQILGLEFPNRAELDRFSHHTRTWLTGMYNQLGSPEMDATLQSRDYLMAEIEKKIDQLLKGGKSDGSILGGLVFASIDADENTNTHEKGKDRIRLTRQEVIEMPYR